MVFNPIVHTLKIKRTDMLTIIDKGKPTFIVILWFDFPHFFPDSPDVFPTSGERWHLM